jgi:hypothetical protein
MSLRAQRSNLPAQGLRLLRRCAPRIDMWVVASNGFAFALPLAGDLLHNEFPLNRVEEKRRT